MLKDKCNDNPSLFIKTITLSTIKNLAATIGAEARESPITPVPFPHTSAKIEMSISNSSLQNLIAGLGIGFIYVGDKALFTVLIHIPFP